MVRLLRVRRLPIKSKGFVSWRRSKGIICGRLSWSTRPWNPRIPRQSPRSGAQPEMKKIIIAPKQRVN